MSTAFEPTVIFSDYQDIIAAENPEKKRTAWTGGLGHLTQNDTQVLLPLARPSTAAHPHDSSTQLRSLTLRIFVSRICAGVGLRGVELYQPIVSIASRRQRMLRV